MRRLRPVPASIPVLVSAVLFAMMLASGCAGPRIATSSSPGVPSVAKPPAGQGPVELPKEIEIRLSLSPGQSWKSRFVSTGEVKRTLSGADNSQVVKSRSVGLEFVATQKVVGVTGTVARIEVAEEATRILREGKFIDAPFRQFNPPARFTFTLDTETGKADFTEMEKAYLDWMADVKAGPAGEILGKTFRVDSYVTQLKELYGKPFARFAGKKIGKEPRSAGEKDFLFPFVGPGVSLGPVPVETFLWYDGFEVKGGSHFLKVAGKYGSGPVERKEVEELSLFLSDFGIKPPESFRRTGEAKGQFEGTVDVLSGREIRSTSQFTYTAATTFASSTLTEEVVGKLILDPVE